MDIQENRDSKILVYHKILPRQLLDTTTVSIANFKRQMAYLERRGVEGTTIDKAFYGKEREKKSIALAFDDAYENVYKNAFPILEKYDFRATIFLISDYVGDYNSWDSSYTGSFKHLDKSQIIELKEHGFEFGSHTRTHPDLSALDDKVIEDELRGSKERIENLIQDQIKYLSIPFGQCNERIIEIARECGYKNVVVLWNSFSDTGLYTLKGRVVYPWESKKSVLRKTNHSKVEKFKDNIYSFGSKCAGFLNSIKRNLTNKNQK